MRILQLTETKDGGKEYLADGCVLPDGQVAIAWRGKHKTHGCYPSLEALEAVQSKIPGRAIEDAEPSYTEMCLGIDVYTFKLIRVEDVTGVSGTGVVAVGCDFPDVGCVIQWTSNYPSTFWYPNMQTVKELHGHEGKTKVEIDERKWM